MKWGSYRGRVPTLFAEVKEVQKMEWELEIESAGAILGHSTPRERCVAAGKK
jgi:hypothetical protein